MLCCALMACKKKTFDFSYSPTTPRAGETVVFSNLSTAGEEWEWTFGDGSTATLKSPSHVYKQPGTYRVILKVDKKNAQTATKEITVFDTVPTFVASDSLFYIYEEYTFTANVYNPYNYSMQLDWTLSDSVISDTGNALRCYFTHPNDSAEIRLRVILNEDTTVIVKRFYIRDQATNSVLFRTSDGDYRQRIFGSRSEEAALTTDATTRSILDSEQDTIQTYNDSTFRLSALTSVFPGIQGFHIASRKIYYRAGGLWVANIDGANPVQIDSLACDAMSLDMLDNRIYWANAQGVWYMPFVGSDNNKFVSAPQQLNALQSITIIATDNTLR